jgi:hypothetical protein
MANLEKYNNRNTLYFDESGVGSFKDSSRYFILTAVIANNNEIKQLSEYYFRLKYKYFNDNIPIHSNELFWKPNSKVKNFIPELTNYLQTLPFGILTVVVDKEKLLKDAPQVKLRNPYQTKLTQAKSIWKQSGFAIETFEGKSVNEVLEVIKNFETKDIDNHYPLRIAYKTILKEYITNYSKNFGLKDCEFEICFETSPNRERILKYTERFYNETKTNNAKEKTSFAKNLKQNVYSISFPNKSSRYLGLEIADMVSYGFNLSRYKRLNEIEDFKPVWDVINKKRVELKKGFNIDCLIEIPRKERRKRRK